MIFFLLTGAIRDLWTVNNTSNSCYTIGLLLLIWGIYEKVFNE
jgi:hypothetical protein